MSGRVRHVTAALIVVVIAGTLMWGCGGAEEPGATSLGGIVTTGPSGGSGSADRASELLGTQLKTTEDTPIEYVGAVEQGRPVVLLFYVAGGADDTKVLDSINRLQPGFPDYVFLLYDYKMTGAYGDLSTLLGVSYPPELVLVDGTGTIREVWNGYVDEGTLNQSLVNLGRG